MIEGYTVLGIFDHIDDAASTIEPLKKFHVPERHVRLLSVAPYPNGAVIHEDKPIPLYIFSIAGLVGGLLAAIALAGVTQDMMNLVVSAKPHFAWPAVGLMGYLFGNLGAVIVVFAGFLWMSGLPDWNSKAYDPIIARGRIGLLVNCASRDHAVGVEQILKACGATNITLGQDDF